MDNLFDFPFIWPVRKTELFNDDVTEQHCSEFFRLDIGSL